MNTLFQGKEKGGGNRKETIIYYQRIISLKK